MENLLPELRELRCARIDNYGFKFDKCRINGIYHRSRTRGGGEKKNESVILFLSFARWNTLYNWDVYAFLYFFFLPFENPICSVLTESTLCFV